MSKVTVLTDRFDRALLYATHVHGGQVRKGTSTPYVAHLLAVAATVLEYGGDEDLTIAALVVIQGSLSTKRIADLAREHRLPAASSTRAFVDAGGLMSYGADGPALFRHGARFVHRVLQGQQPSDLPIEQPTKLELAINLKTAKAMGLTIPEAFLLRADTLIE
jgi:ABC transporter substrate binding protein/HD domain